MDSRGQWHPSDQELRKFSNGRLDDGRSESINNHLLECPACQRRYIKEPLPRMPLQ